MLESIKRMKDIQFYALMAVLVAAESLLVLAGALPPMTESNPVHTLFFWLRMLSFAAFGFVLLGKPLKEAALKGGLMALSGVVIEIVFLFMGRVLGKPLLGIAIPNETVLYVALIITAVANTIFGAALVFMSAWFFRMLMPKEKERKRRRR